MFWGFLLSKSMSSGCGPAGWWLLMIILSYTLGIVAPGKSLPTNKYNALSLLIAGIEYQSYYLPNGPNGKFTPKREYLQRTSCGDGQFWMSVEGMGVTRFIIIIHYSHPPNIKHPQMRAFPPAKQILELNEGLQLGKSSWNNHQLEVIDTFSWIVPAIINFPSSSWISNATFDYGRIDTAVTSRFSPQVDFKRKNALHFLQNIEPHKDWAAITSFIHHSPNFSHHPKTIGRRGSRSRMIRWWTGLAWGIRWCLVDVGNR